MRPFISTGDLGALLGQDVTTDPLAVIAIDSACEVVRSYCGQRLNYDAADTITLNGNGRHTMLLPELPIVSVSSVAIDEEVLTDYYTEHGMMTRLGRYDTWDWGIQNIVVTYAHGYAVIEADVEDDPDDATPKPDRMPSDIRRVALSIAQRGFAAAGTVVGALASETISPDSYAYTLADASTQVSASAVMSAEEEQILDHHKIDRVA